MSNITPINQAIQTIETPAFKTQLQQLLPQHVKTEQFLSVARRGIIGNKSLNFDKMNKQTLYSSVLKAAEQGLKLDGEEAALVQYGEAVQFMKMIKGVKKQLRNSGEIKEITAEVVYKNDKFEYWVDDNGKHIKHTPEFLNDRGEPICAYAIITTKDGGKFIKVMTKQEIESVKSASKTGNASFSPWNGVFKTEMWCKTVLRRCAKDAPTSTDLPEVFKDWDEDFDFTNTNQATENKSAQNQETSSQAKPTRKRKSVIYNIIENEKEAEPQDPTSFSDDNDEISTTIDSKDIPI